MIAGGWRGTFGSNHALGNPESKRRLLLIIRVGVEKLCVISPKTSSTLAL
jgi:hypothetical protein